jgi:hypothetical protein
MKKPYWLVALLLAAELFLILVFVPGKWTEQVIVNESAMVERTLGHNSVQWINERALRWYSSTMVDSGVYQGLHTLLIPSPEERARSRGMENLGSTIFPWLEDRLFSMMRVFYQVFARMALLMVWAPYMLILLIPAMYDGWLNWKIKRTNFDYASPVIHRYGVRGIVLMLQILLIAFFAPIALNPIVIPFAMMIACVMIGLAMGNIQKRI